MTAYFDADEVEAKLVELRDHIEHTRWNTNAHEFAHATAKLEALEEVFEILRSRAVEVEGEARPLAYGEPSLVGDIRIRLVVDDQHAGGKLIDVVRGAVARNELLLITPNDGTNPPWSEANATYHKSINWQILKRLPR